MAGAGGGNDDWYRQYLQQQFDSVELAPGEAYLGGTDSDAQPCGADQGGPMVRKLQGQVRVFGLFSRTPFGSCDKGALYASITPDAKAFVDVAAQWKDPCTGLTANGKCVGNTATRCSSSTEGKRRAVKFDCSLLNQACVGGGNTEVACSDKWARTTADRERPLASTWARGRSTYAITVLGTRLSIAVGPRPRPRRARGRARWPRPTLW